MSEINASYSMLWEFTESIVWRDMQNALMDLLEDVRNHLESEKDPSELLRYQGRAEGIRIALGVPNILMNGITFEQTSLKDDDYEEDDE